MWQRELYEGKLNTERDVLEAKSQLQKAEDQLQRSNSGKYGLECENRKYIQCGSTDKRIYCPSKSINKDMQLRSDRSE